MEVSVCLYQASELPHPRKHVTVRVYYPERYVIIILRRMPASLTAKILRQTKKNTLRQM